jgi:hypothetical protein
VTPPLDLTVVTVCMNRREHLLCTAPVLARWAWHAEHLVIDWSSEQPLRREELPADPRLRLLRVEGEQAWNPSRAYNFACSQARRAWLLRLDADCAPTPAFQPAEAIATGGVWVGSGPDGRFGQFLLPTARFRAVGGFNEAMRGWGFEDKDLRARLEAQGLELALLPADWIAVIPHSEALRTLAVPAGSGRLQRSRSLALKQAQMLANRLVAAHRPWSAQRPSSRYRQEPTGVWRAEPDSIPKLEGPAAVEIAQARRLVYWSRFLAVPELFLELLPEARFPAPDAAGRELHWSHLVYWASARRLLKALLWGLRLLLQGRSAP